MNNEMKDYLEYWNSIEGVKPKNDPVFIQEFVGFMKERDKDHYEFKGENYYCGNTAIIYDDNPMYCMSRTTCFEFAYGSDFVKVFTGHHSGFWVPEYISLCHEDAEPVLEILKQKFIEWGGFA